MEKNTTISSLGQGKLLTASETQNTLRCSRTFLWKERKAGKLKAIKAGKKVLFSKNSIDAYLILSQEEVKNG